MLLNNNDHIELLAPAGNMECLIAAVSMGADAVYLSGKDFGARSYADNFKRDEIVNAVEYCHLRGVKVHVTVNTLLGDKELTELREYLKFLDSAGVDALIIQDLGVLRVAKELGVRPQLHASTQLTVHSLDGALSAARLGFDRVVLARELDYDNIKLISDGCGIETEMFIHGAMCMSYSGQCLMSSMLGGRSGNRGRCAQPCRQPYSCDGGGEKFCLSLKDMSLSERIDMVKTSGVSSLKIEGRMKGAAYVGCVVKIYADCIREGRRPTDEEVKRLNQIFFRGGQTSGYFDGRLGTDMFAFDKPDNPYKGGSDEVAKHVISEINKQSNKFKIYLDAKADIAVGEKIRLSVYGDGFKADVCGCSVVEPAKSKPIDKESAARQISKTGGSVFEFKDISVDIAGEPYVPLSEINDVRRRALCAAKEQILKSTEPKKRGHLKQSIRKAEYKLSRGMTASVLNISQYDAVLEYEAESGNMFSYISMPISVILESSDRLGTKERIIADLPAIINDSEYDEYKLQLDRLKNLNINKLRINNISGFTEYDSGFLLFGSQRLNITNSLALKECAENGICAAMPSIELSLPQIRDIIKGSELPVEVMVYGYAPLMVTENCIIKNLNKSFCPCSGDAIFMTDRLGKRFPIVRDGASCRSVMLNSVPLYLADRLDDIKNLSADMMNLYFTIESADEIKRICAAYFGDKNYKINEYTRMHYYKGII